VPVESLRLRLRHLKHILPASWRMKLPYIDRMMLLLLNMYVTAQMDMGCMVHSWVGLGWVGSKFRHIICVRLG